MLEMLSLGKAVHVVPRTELEKSFARIFAERGALLGIGMDSLRSPDTASLGASAVRGPQLVDGRGCERIAAALEELL
jgi:hypothetical protein